MSDFSFVDHWQNKFHDGVGWMRAAQLTEKFSAGRVLIAEDASGPVGHVIGCDRWMKHDDIGIIYQVSVVPQQQRGLVGAMLVKAMFERAAYGCKLFSCWCAQNLEANHFFESLGFLPLAFRTGANSRRRGTRTHIFWQRRIREGDTTTPYWFPSETTGGAMRENRLVLPIPPGTHWKDVMPVVLPGAQPPALPNESKQKRAPRLSESPARPRVGVVTLSRARFALPPSKPDKPRSPTAGKRVKKPHVKNDPAHVAAARELRDRYLEQFNSGMAQGGLPQGKYEISRQLQASAGAQLSLVGQKQLSAAA